MLWAIDDALTALERLYWFAVELLGFILTPVFRIIALCVKPRDHHEMVAVRMLPPSALAPLPAPVYTNMNVKTLVLDLDETLVHSFHSTPVSKYNMALKVTIDNVEMTFYVRFRPHVELFLKTVSLWYEVVVFTASLPQYGNPVIDALDRNRALVRRRFFRDSCTITNAIFAKDLSLVQSDLSRVAIIDNSPGAYSLHPENAIPIKTWTNDAGDSELLALLPFLDALRHTTDVRSVLALRTRV